METKVETRTILGRIDTLLNRLQHLFEILVLQARRFASRARRGAQYGW